MTAGKVATYVGDKLGEVPKRLSIEGPGCRRWARRNQVETWFGVLDGASLSLFIHQLAIGGVMETDLTRHGELEGFERRRLDHMAGHGFRCEPQMLVCSVRASQNRIPLMWTIRRLLEGFRT